jgi:hypothetical protein
MQPISEQVIDERDPDIEEAICGNNSIGKIELH